MRRATLSHCFAGIKHCPSLFPVEEVSLSLCVHGSVSQGSTVFLLRDTDVSRAVPIIVFGPGHGGIEEHFEASILA